MSFNQIEYHKLKVLVVEDETHTRTIIKSLLRQLGVRDIQEAANGRDGLVKVTVETPHLVLCDIHMRPVNGLEFLQTLRKLPDAKFANTPVVFLTADANRDSVMIAKENAANGYLVKPVSLDSLKQRVDAVAVKLEL